MSFISKAINFRSKRNLAYLADTLQIRYLAFIVAQRLMDTNLHLKKCERLLVSETGAIVNSHIQKNMHRNVFCREDGQRGWWVESTTELLLLHLLCCHVWIWPR